MTPPVRVVLADDEPLLRDTLAELIAAHPRFDLAGQAADADEAIALVLAVRPEVALVDVKMPGGGGPHVARELSRRAPATRVVALSAYADRATVLDMIRAGAVGYIVKGAPWEELVDTILGCARGESRMSGEVTADVLAELSSHLEREAHEAAEHRRKLALVERVLRADVRVVFQPIVSLEDGAVLGVEALSRFPDDLPSPPAWFAAAESVGLGRELELHAARAAISLLPSLERAWMLFVNLSPGTLSAWPPLPLRARDARRIVVEITEHAPIEDYGRLATTLAALRDGGVRTAVDDVGAGFANFKHILQLAPDFIKLDASLTKGIESDRSRRALASALISFAAELEATILAEGIETRAELETLRALGVRYGQGYYIARPGELPIVTRPLP